MLRAYVMHTHSLVRMNDCRWGNVQSTCSKLSNKIDLHAQLVFCAEAYKQCNHVKNLHVLMPMPTTEPFSHFVGHVFWSTRKEWLKVKGYSSRISCADLPT